MAMYEIVVTDHEQFKRAIVVVGLRMRQENIRTATLKSQLSTMQEHRQHLDLRKQAFLRGFRPSELPSLITRMAEDWRATETRIAALDAALDAELRAIDNEPLQFVERVRACTTMFRQHDELPVLVPPHIPAVYGNIAYVTDQYVVAVRAKGDQLAATLCDRATGEVKDTQRGVRMDQVLTLKAGQLGVQKRDTELARTYHPDEFGLAAPFLDIHTSTQETRIYNPSTDKYVVLALATSGRLELADICRFAIPHRQLGASHRHYLRFVPGAGHPAVIVSISAEQLF